MDLQWRAASGADLAQILQIERNTQRVPWSRLAFEESLTRSEQVGEAPCFFTVLHCEDAAEEGDLIVGFQILSLVLDELHILNLAVAPAFHGQGLGHSIMSKIFETAEQNAVRKLYLEVRASNLKAQSLYEKWGFEQVAKRKQYYRTEDQEREDALVYLRQLRKTVSA